VWRRSPPPTAHINTKSILHQVSYISPVYQACVHSARTVHDESSIGHASSCRTCLHFLNHSIDSQHVRSRPQCGDTITIVVIDLSVRLPRPDPRPPRDPVTRRFPGTAAAAAAARRLGRSSGPAPRERSDRPTADPPRRQREGCFARARAIERLHVYRRPPPPHRAPFARRASLRPSRIPSPVARPSPVAALPARRPAAPIDRGAQAQTRRVCVHTVPPPPPPPPPTNPRAHPSHDRVPCSAPIKIESVTKCG